MRAKPDLPFVGLKAGLNQLAAIVLGLMALVSFVDVCLRALGRPITGAYELTALLVGLLIYSSLPGVTALDAHVRAGVFGAWLDRRPGLTRLLRYFRNACNTCVFAGLALALASYAQKLAQAGDRAPFIEVPLAWVAGFGALMFIFSAYFAVRAQAGQSTELS
jgi:TRAP-type transport system small permease protein